MATMQALLEKDKERFLNNMSAAKSSATAIIRFPQTETVSEQAASRSARHAIPRSIPAIWRR